MFWFHILYRSLPPYTLHCNLIISNIIYICIFASINRYSFTMHFYLTDLSTCRICKWSSGCASGECEGSSWSVRSWGWGNCTCIPVKEQKSRLYPRFFAFNHQLKYKCNYCILDVGSSLNLCFVVWNKIHN